MEFLTIVEEHAARYPRMLPQDYGKLAYQSKFGPAHLGMDQEAGILAEWRLEDLPDRPPETIGGGLCRFHLTDAYDPQEAAPLLARLLALTAQSCQGTMDGLLEKLALLEGRAGLGPWLADYRRQGCPPVRHSEVFRQTYRPHYRLLQAPYAGYFPALLTVDRLARRGGPAVVAIDGRCGSGKTGLAALLVQLFPCRVLHMDDFYRPFSQRGPDWEQVPGGNMDLERFAQECLRPARTGAPIRYRAFDCRQDAFRPVRTLPACPLTIVEGSYSQHPLLADAYGLRIFLTCGEAVQLRRLSQREGAAIQGFRQRWIPMEERYFHACRIREGCALTIDTGRLF